MPITIPNNLPAAETLSKENIFVMKEARAKRQDIRPLRVAILNLMPTKIKTETQILRLLSNTPIQIEIVLLHPKSHVSKNTPQNHLDAFYKYFDDVKSEKFDGMIITGAPVEQLNFEEVDYWPELTGILDWTKSNVFSTFHICWGAQAGLYYHYKIPKYPIPRKLFGIFPHTINKKHTKLLRGFDDVFYAPQSRHTEVRKKDIEEVLELEILSESKDSGVYIIGRKDGRQFFVTGHSEYDPFTLRDEYERDVSKGLKIAVPKNYYPKNDPSSDPIVNWRSHASLLFSNWLNYHVYQETPYRLNEIK